MNKFKIFYKQNNETSILINKDGRQTRKEVKTAILLIIIIGNVKFIFEYPKPCFILRLFKKLFSLV